MIDLEHADVGINLDPRLMSPGDDATQRVTMGPGDIVHDYTPAGLNVKSKASASAATSDSRLSGPTNMRKYYEALNDLIGEETDASVHERDSDFDGAGAFESDDEEDDDEDYAQATSSEDEKNSKRKRKRKSSTRSPSKAIPSPPRKRRYGTASMSSRITDRIVPVSRKPTKTRYEELKEAFCLDKTPSKGRSVKMVNKSP